MLIAIPTAAPGGLDAPISEHFGHCEAFTLVELDGEKLGDVTVLANLGHEEGGCMAPVRYLKEHDVEALVAGGMGMRPLAGFRSVGITVYFRGEAQTAREAVELLVAGKCREFGKEQTCGGGTGGCGGHGHHHHEPIVREPIAGVADVREGRVVSMHFKLRDTDGTLIDSTDEGEPVRFLCGHSSLLPALEKELYGLEAGAERAVRLSAADAFGERADDRILEVPRDRLPPGVAVGMTLQGRLPDGGYAALKVLALDDSVAKLDANHPLAGKELVFDVTVVRVEAATADELAEGRLKD